MSETNDRLNQLLDLAGEHARKVLIEDGGTELIPVYLLHNPSGESVIVTCVWHDEAEKRAILAEVRHLARKHQASALSFVGEAWTTNTVEAPDALGIPPSEHPKRREVVFAVATTKWRTRSRQWQIVRDRPGGRIIALVEAATAGTMSGRIVDGILP